MERNRESLGRRTLGGGISSSSSSSSIRRPPPPPLRTKDGSDDEERMDEMAMEQPRAWERPRKERVPSTIHLPSSSSLNPRSKRRRHTGFSHESHVSGRLNVRPEDAEESAEDTEMVASEDEDEPPPPPPLIRRPLKPRTHPKEDEMVMDIPSVPRKARSSISSSSRFSSVSRRSQEAVQNDTIRNKSLGPTQPSLNGSSSPVSLHKPGKRLKPVTPKFRAVKVPKVSEVSAISDQEAEVAEALFSLAWSTPSQSGLMELKPEVRHDMEDRTATSAAATSPIEQIRNASNSHLRDSAKSSIEAPRRKRPRVVIKQEEGKLPTPSQSSVPISASSLAVKTEPEPSLERSQNLPTDAASVSSECLNDKDILNTKQPQLHHKEEKNQHEVEVPLKEVIAEGDGEIGDQQSVCADTIKVLSNGKDAADTDGDIPVETKSLTKIDLPNRCVDDLCENNGEVSEGKIDLMHSAAEDDAPGALVPKPSSGNDTSIYSTNQSTEASKYTMDEPPKASVKDMNDASLNCKEWINEGKQQESSAQLYESQETEHQVSQIIKAPKEENEYSRTYSKSQKEDTDNGVSSSFVSSIPSAGPSSLGWIGGIPQMGYYGPGATGWIAGASIPTPNDVVKVTHPNMQLPHTTILPPVPRMKRCATHVYIAHFISHAQQVSRHSLWSAALCRAPYNLNIPPVTIHDNEKHGAYVDVTRKASAQQPGPSYGYTISQSSTPGTSGAGATPTVSASNHAAGTGNVDHGTNAAPSNVMAAHAHQYLQAMMQQNGFATFPFPFNGPSGQAAQFFNSPFFPPHMMPPLTQLQPLPPVGSGLPAAQQQQVSLPHQSSSSQQLQLQVAPPSPSSSQQQHSHLNNSASHFGSLIERDSSVGGGDTLSTTDGRLSAMQRNMCDQGGSSNLPNLNVSPKLATSIPAIRSHDQDVSSGGKQNASKSQFQSQAQALPMQQQQYMQQNSGSGMNQPTQGYTSIMVSGATRATTGSPRGLVNVAPLMTTQGHGLLSGSAESTRMHVQQQQIYGAHNSQYQRAMTKGSSSNEEAVVFAVKGRDQNEDKKVSSGKQQLASLPHISRVDMEVSSPSGSSGRLNNNANIGRTPTSAMISDTRNTTKPTSSVGIVGQQTPILQSQQQSKQSTSRTKAGLATNAVPLMPNHVNMYGYVDKPPIHGDGSKFAGTGVPFSSQTVSSSQGNSKQNAHHGNMMKNGQKQSISQQAASPISATTIKSQGQQQARNNINNNNSSNMNPQQQAAATSTTSKMMPSVSALPTMPSGSQPIGPSHLLSGPKSAAGSVSKSPSNGKGANSMATKSAPSTKKPSLTGSVSLTSSIGSMPPKAAMTATTTATTQQKNQAVMHTQQFTQQQHPSHVPTQPAKMANKSAVYPQQGQQYKQVLQQQTAPYRPPFFLQHQQQYLQSSSPSQQQQQPHSQHLQPASQHHYQQHTSNIATQHGQTQQQLRPDSHALQHLQKQQIPVAVASPVSNNGGGFSVGSSNLTLGTNSTTLGNKHSDLASDGSDQFKGQHDRANISRGIYNSAGVITTSAPREMLMTAHPPVSGQVSPHSSSSQFLQPSTMKSLEQKLSSDITREEMSSAPPQIAVAASNPLS